MEPTDHVKTALMGLLSQHSHFDYSPTRRDAGAVSVSRKINKAEFRSVVRALRQDKHLQSLLQMGYVRRSTDRTDQAADNCPTFQVQLGAKVSSRSTKQPQAPTNQVKPDTNFEPLELLLNSDTYAFQLWDELCAESGPNGAPLLKVSNALLSTFRQGKFDKEAAPSPNGRVPSPSPRAPPAGVAVRPAKASSSSSPKASQPGRPTLTAVTIKRDNNSTQPHRASTGSRLGAKRGGGDPATPALVKRISPAASIVPASTRRVNTNTRRLKYFEDIDGGEGDGEVEVPVVSISLGSMSPTPLIMSEGLSAVPSPSNTGPKDDDLSMDAYFEGPSVSAERSPSRQLVDLDADVEGAEAPTVDISTLTPNNPPASRILRLPDTFRESSSVSTAGPSSPIATKVRDEAIMSSPSYKATESMALAALKAATLYRDRYTVRDVSQSIAPTEVAPLAVLPQTFSPSSARGPSIVVDLDKEEESDEGEESYKDQETSLSQPDQFREESCQPTTVLMSPPKEPRSASHEGDEGEQLLLMSPQQLEVNEFTVGRSITISQPPQPSVSHVRASTYATGTSVSAVQPYAPHALRFQSHTLSSNVNAHEFSKRFNLQSGTASLLPSRSNSAATVLGRDEKEVGSRKKKQLRRSYSAEAVEVCEVFTSGSSRSPHLSVRSSLPLSESPSQGREESSATMNSYGTEVTATTSRSPMSSRDTQSASSFSSPSEPRRPSRSSSSPSLSVDRSQTASCHSSARPSTASESVSSSAASELRYQRRCSAPPQLYEMATHHIQDPRVGWHWQPPVAPKPFITEGHYPNIMTETESTITPAHPTNKYRTNLPAPPFFQEVLDGGSSHPPRPKAVGPVPATTAPRSHMRALPKEMDLGFAPNKPKLRQCKPEMNVPLVGHSSAYLNRRCAPGFGLQGVCPPSGKGRVRTVTFLSGAAGSPRSPRVEGPRVEVGLRKTTLGTATSLLAEAEPEITPLTPPPPLDHAVKVAHVDTVTEWRNKKLLGSGLYNLNGGNDQLAAAQAEVVAVIIPSITPATMVCLPQLLVSAQSSPHRLNETLRPEDDEPLGPSALSISPEPVKVDEPTFPSRMPPKLPSKENSGDLAPDVQFLTALQTSRALRYGASPSRSRSISAPLPRNERQEERVELVVKVSPLQLSPADDNRTYVAPAKIDGDAEPKVLAVTNRNPLQALSANTFNLVESVFSPPHRPPPPARVGTPKSTDGLKSPDVKKRIVKIQVRPAGLLAPMRVPQTPVESSAKRELSPSQSRGSSVASTSSSIISVRAPPPTRVVLRR